MEKRLDEVADQETPPAHNRYESTTDPDASVIRHTGGRSKPRYKTHRGVDPAHEVITTTKVTPGSHDEGGLLKAMLAIHEANTHKSVDTVVADSKYGTIENFLFAHDRGIEAHLPSLEKRRRGSGRQKGIFSKEDFIYNPDDDTFICPAGQMLTKRNYITKQQQYEYKASSSICARCHLRPDCTRAKAGRTLKRHLRQNELDRMLAIASSQEAKRDIQTRQHLSERSFAHAALYGYKRARWRRLWRMEIQDFLIAAVQNIRILIKHVGTSVANVAKASVAYSQILFTRVYASLVSLFGLNFIWSNKKSEELYPMSTLHR